MSDKIFYVSLQRTGTKSFGQFFANNGYKAVSWSVSHAKNWPQLSIDGNFPAILESEEFKNGEIFEDGPWSHVNLVKYLYWAVPNSYFVYFDRPFEDWFDSMISHSKGANPGNAKRHATVYNCLEDYYGLVDRGLPARLDLASRKEVYRRAFMNHRLQIRAFFEDKDPKRFFCADLYDKEKYKKLAAFWGLSFQHDDDIHIHKSNPKV
ncbi:sulfotransferase [Thalassospira sp.]|uniref:sulfotransferase n=1 Tax=Thalassospira sp. TaxID=1912094 RepID=UPI000C4A0780|nr:sulfotransferase [Thalassospira sp.]MBC07323.1 hypothetical protein [Thalassospira sp.]|tara:strand:- start:10858 stop:11481 length:624 start_codon:yes stop_codon:yes gene_type:complete